MCAQKSSVSRRRFLQSTAVVGAAAALDRPLSAAPDPLSLPKVQFRNTEVTRLIIGSNSLYGYTHFNVLFNKFMQEWMTQDRRMEVLHRCERAGINTWQLHYMKHTMEDFKRYRAEGGKMNWFLLGDAEMMSDLTLIGKVAREFKPIGIAHHGNRTDDRFKAGEKDKVQEFCKAVRDSGVMVGVSMHNPEVMDIIESENWDVDYYMTCMYYVSRRKEEAREKYGEASVGEIYMEGDPERMSRMIRQTKRPCLAFKIFGAGRTCDNTKQVEASFKLAFEKIKPTDAVIVGMCPAYKDEISENVAMTAKYGRPVT
jgi:hypothetical protein